LPQVNRVERLGASGEIQASGASFTDDLGSFACRAYAVR